MPAWPLILIRHWKLVLTGLALTILATTAAYYRIDRDHWRGVAKALRIDLDRVKVATELADQKARAAKLAQEAEYRRKADEADREYQADLADARARADRYARLNRVRPQAGGSPGGPVAAPGGADAGGADQEGQDAFVAISRADFDAATENALRLQAAHEWACKQEGAKCE